MTPLGRTEPDRCPGVLAVHEAADGGLARVRLPGGVLSAQQLRVLAAAAVELGDGHLELTSRANVQIRALRPGAPVELSERLYAAGLLPSISHERVRNILASPLSGLDTHGRYDVLPLARDLDRLLCARPALAELPGRFLFALDDGRGDLASAKADVAVRMVDSQLAELLLAGAPTGVLLPPEQAPDLMVAAAEAFLAERAQQQSEAWRLAELLNGPQRVLARLGLQEQAALQHVPGEHLAAGAGTAQAVEACEGGPALEGEGRVPRAAVPRAGWVQDGVGVGAFVVGVPLGVLDGEQAAVIAGVAGGWESLGASEAVLRVTRGRGVVVVGVAEEDLTQLAGCGLVVEAESAWNGVTSCAGRPGCGKALGDVRGDARRVVPGWSGGQKAVHWSGCERRCGKPGGEFVDVVALASGGYSVDGVAMTVDEVGDGVRVQ
ncbi:precorrin-3B synthase [Kribbella sp. NPDC023855]|uniref:precorrin-3B synthase n=1 Tax=Kribbella sp. NPDC023855 TaxID=3154698 RepID=UPI0033C5BDC1